MAGSNEVPMTKDAGTLLEGYVNSGVLKHNTNEDGTLVIPDSGVGSRSINNGLDRLEHFEHVRPHWRNAVAVVEEIRARRNNN